MKSVSYYFAFLFVTLTFIGCKDKSTASSGKELFKQYVSSSESTIFYGKINPMALVEKSMLVTFPLFGAIVSEQKERLEQALQLNDGIYFSMDGPLDYDGMPARFFAFASIKNVDSLKSIFSEAGYFFEEKGDLFFADDMGASIAFNHELVVFASLDFDDDQLEVLKSVFNQCYQKQHTTAINETVAALLDESNDFQVVTHLENLYNTSNTDLSDLPEDKQKEIKALTKEGHIATSLNFLNGEIKLATKNMVNSNLKSMLEVMKTTDKNHLSHLNLAAPIFALNLSLDMVKLEETVAAFDPNAMRSFYQSLGTAGLLLKGIGGDGLNAFISGAFGLSIDAMPANLSMEELPELTFAMEMGNSGKALIDILMDLSFITDFEKKTDGSYHWNNLSARIQNNYFLLRSMGNNEIQNAAMNKRLVELGFGDKPIQFFADLQQLLSSDFEIKSRELKLFLSLFDFAFFEMNEDGAILTIQMKNKEINVLENMLKSFQKELEENIDFAI